MGQRESLSHSDEAKINRMYKCDRKPHNTHANGHRHFQGRFVNEIATLFNNYASPEFWRGLFNPQHLRQELPPHLLPQPYFNDFGAYLPPPYGF